MADRIILTIGTKKGVFVADAAKPRRSFALRGPFGPGVPVYSTLIDTRGTPRLYASSCNPFFGMKVLRSTDMGKSFKETKSAPAFPKEDGRALANKVTGDLAAHFAANAGDCVHGFLLMIPYDGPLQLPPEALRMKPSARGSSKNSRSSATPRKCKQDFPATNMEPARQ